MLGWLEESPKIAVNAAFENRGYEIKISEIYYHEGGLETLQAYLETEEIVESTCIIHRSLFLYNLNNRSSNFSVLNPPVNHSDFYISLDDLSNGAFFIPNEFLEHIKPMLKVEEGSDISFGQDNTKVIISRQILSLIEKSTNKSLAIGSPINFSIATQFLPENHEELADLSPLMLGNQSPILTIGAIYDRIPSQTQVAFGLEFYHETLGDGLYISDELLSENITSEIEENGFFPTLYVRLNRTYLTQNPIDSVIPQINYLTARIYQQGRYKIEVQTDEIQSLLFMFNQSFFVLILLLLPILVCAEIFYIALIPHLLNSRTEEFYYLRLRGTSDRKMALIGGVEFTFLTFLGVLGGFLGGSFLLDILLSTSKFLQIPFEYGRGRSLLENNTNVWLTGVIIAVLLNFGYFIILFKRLIKKLQQFDHERQNNRFLSSNKSITSTILKLLIAGLILYLAFTTVTPTLLNELGASDISIQLIPLIVVLVMALWVLFSFYIPQFCLRIIQSIFESLRIFKNPKKRITWVNLFRRRSQFISILALITLTVSLFTFAIVYEETIKDNSNKNADYLVGGDLKLITDDVNTTDFTSQLVNISGIDHCIGFPSRSVTIARHSIVLIGIDPDKYWEISSVYPESIVEGPVPSSFWHSLSDDPLHSVIINNYLSEVFKWEIGSVTQVLDLLTGYGAEWNLSVTGILNSAPGIGSLYPGEYISGVYNFGGYAFVHKDLLEAFGTTSANVFIIRLNSTNSIDLQSNLIGGKLREINEIRVILESTSVEKYQQDFFHLAGVQGLLTIDALGAIAIAILGVAVFYQYLISERLQEFAIFQAFGATRRNISKLVLNESLFLTGIGIVLGVITGNLFALGLLFATRTVTISPNNIFLLELSISPIILGFGLIIVALIIFLTSLIPTFKIYGHEITTLLREL
jgi:ABC-type antimicrobial peptide transport system permease subunit